MRCALVAVVCPPHSKKKSVGNATQRAAHETSLAAGRMGHRLHLSSSVQFFESIFHKIAITLNLGLNLLVFNCHWDNSQTNSAVGVED
jgi:hypothetical protein